MQFGHLKRREFITALGGAAGWPLAVRAQQPKMPVIGFLDSSVERTSFLAVLQQGLGDAGYVLHENATIVYRWAAADYARLPTLAAELVQRPVNLLVGSGTPAALAAKAATSKMPIVFSIGLKRSTQNLQLSTSCWPITPSSGGE